MTPKFDIPPTDPPDFVPDPEPDAVATPQGDNECPADEPLCNSSPPPERPRGNEPHYNQPIRKALD